MLEAAIFDLVDANRILAHENVVDAYGHVSIRHPSAPDRFLLARSLSPELVEAADILEFGIDGEPTAPGPTPYLERFIHAGIYEARPDVMAVVHSHEDAVLPFTVTDTPLFPVIHTASDMGATVPNWDIADEFGATNLLVTNRSQGRGLARCLGVNSTVLMRGHGFACVGRSLVEAVKIAVYVPRNARVLADAMRFGAVKPLSEGEIAIRSRVAANSPQMRRAWDYWRTRAGRCPGCAPTGPGLTSA